MTEEIVPCDYDLNNHTGGISKEELNKRLVKPLRHVRGGGGWGWGDSLCA